MKKYLAIFLAMLLSVSALAGCGKDTQEDQQENTRQEEQIQEESETTDSGNMDSKQCKGNVLTWNIAFDTETLDPAHSVTTDSKSLVNNLFEGLMRNDGKAIVPAIAEGAPSEEETEDGIVLTYTLKEAFWSDGQPVTANDFEYAWKRCVDPETKSENAYLMSVIAGYDDIAQGLADKDSLAVKALDDKTLEVTLKQTTPYFDELLTLPAFMPLREDMQEFKDPMTAVSNGPFTLAGYTEQKEFVLKKNPQYHNADSVSLDYVVARMLNENFAPVAMAFGDIMMTGGTVSQPQDQTDTEGNTVKVPELPQTLKETTVNTNTVVNLLINQNTTNPLLKSHKGRVALSLAVNRQEAAENAGNAVALTSATTTSGEMLPASAELEDANKLMEEYLSQNKDADKTVEIVYLANDEMKAALESVQAAWKELGIDVTLVAETDVENFKRIRNSLQYKDIICSAWEADAADEQLYLQPFLTSNMQSGCGYTNPKFDEEMIKAMESKGEERSEYLLEAETILLKDAYVIPLYQKVMTVTSDTARVNGWELLPNGTYWFGDAFLGAEKNVDEESKEDSKEKSEEESEDKDNDEETSEEESEEKSEEKDK